MKRITSGLSRATLLVALGALIVVPNAGCKKKDKSENPDEAAEAAVDPLEELKGIPGQIQAEVDGVLQPINDIDVVIDQMAAIPGKYEIDAASLTGMVKGSFDGGKAEVSADVNVSEEAKAEIQTLLQTAGGIATGLKELPKRSVSATKNIVALGAKAGVLVGKLQAKYQAKLSSPFTKAEEKAKIQGELNMVLKLQGDIKATIGDAKATVMGVPAKGTEALSKITAAFAGGASAGSDADAGAEGEAPAEADAG
jgi:hypothetical protein